MGDHFTYSGFAQPGRDIRVMEQQVLPKGHRTPVFHGAKGKIGNGNEVQFGQGIWDGVVFFAKLKSQAAEFEAEGRIGFHAGQRHRADPGIYRVFDDLKFADTKEDQVG